MGYFAALAPLLGEIGGTAAGTAGGTAGLQQLFQQASDFAGQLIGNMIKSRAQKDAEYALSAGTNEIEKAMDINRISFWTGFISLNQAITNYNYLWGLLNEIARNASEITPAQAARTISDRDYGGPFAHEWRFLFRDEMVEIPQDHLTQVGGTVVPDWRWPVDASILKYGPESSTIKTPAPLPAPSQIGAGPQAGAAGGAGAALASLKEHPVLAGALLIGGLWLARKVL